MSTPYFPKILAREGGEEHGDVRVGNEWEAASLNLGGCRLVRTRWRAPCSTVHWQIDRPRSPVKPAKRQVFCDEEKAVVIGRTDFQRHNVRSASLGNGSYASFSATRRSELFSSYKDKDFFGVARAAAAAIAETMDKQDGSTFRRDEGNGPRKRRLRLSRFWLVESTSGRSLVRISNHRRSRLFFFFFFFFFFSASSTGISLGTICR